jgi:hypothetical protein
MDRQQFAVQCKRFRGTVDPNDVRALAGVVATAGYAGGIFMTTGAMSQTTRAEAKHAGLTVYTGQDLIDLALRMAPTPASQPRAVPSGRVGADVTPSSDVFPDIPGTADGFYHSGDDSALDGVGHHGHAC